MNNKLSGFWLYRVWITALFFWCFHCAAQTYAEKHLLGFLSREEQYGQEQKIDSLNHILIIAKTDNDQKTVCNCLRNLGIVYQVKDRRDSAIGLYIRALKLADSLNYTEGKASCANQVAAFYSEIESDSLTILYLNMAFDSYKSVNYYRGMADAKLNIAKVLKASGRLPESERYCLQSIYYRKTGLCKDTNIKGYHMGYDFDLISEIYLAQHDLSSALRYSKMAVDSLLKGPDVANLAYALLHQGEIYLESGMPEKAINSFYKTLLYGSTIRSRQLQYNASSCIAEYYERSGRTDSALKYLKQSFAYHDSIENISKDDLAREMAVKYETEKKEMELRTQQKLIEDSYYLNFALAILVILLLITILVIIRNFSQRKKIVLKESELQNANAMLMGQDEERERIARELHDRVGSMLSTVKLHFTSMEDHMKEHMSELLKMQGKSYHQAIELLDETYEEVRRISHDLDTGLLGRFGLRTAMMQLAQVLESTNKLKVLYLDNDLDPQVYKAFETDLYRITQELLSNTIKYAKAKEISIQLSRTNGNLVYSYEDDGIGFIKEELQNSKGIGYKNIDTRVQRMKGTWHLDTNPGNGLNLIIELPVNGNTHHHS